MAGGCSVKARWAYVARVFGISPRRAQTFWYCTPTASVRADELAHLRARSHELLIERARQLDAERAIIFDRLSHLEKTRNAACLAVGRDVLDRSRKTGSDAGRVVQEQVAQPAVRRA